MIPSLVGVAGLIVGLWVGLTTPPLSGGTFLALILFGAGGWLLADVIEARRTYDDNPMEVDQW